MAALERLVRTKCYRSAETVPPSLSNPRMQPTGRKGARLPTGSTLLERGKERRLVQARA